MPTTATLESRALELLAARNLFAHVRSAKSLSVRDCGRDTDVLVKVGRAQTYDWELRRLLDSTPDNVLLVLPRASQAVCRLAAVEPRLSVVSLEDQTVIWRTKTLPAPHSKPEPQAQSRRRPWGRWALMRVLTMSSRPMSQTQLARAAGVTQPAVSQAMPRLGELVERDARGWFAADRVTMWDAFMDAYPGPGGVSTFWFSMDPVVDQARTAANAARREGVAALISGDAAADRVAPWRVPSRAVLHADTAADLAAAGFAEASASTASLEYVVAQDPTISATAKFRGAPAKITDPLIAAWHVARTGSSDADEAIRLLRESALA